MWFTRLDGDSYGSRGGDSYDSGHGDTSRGEKRRLTRQFNGVSDACLHVDAKGLTATESCLGNLSLAPFRAADMSFAVLGSRFCYSQWMAWIRVCRSPHRQILNA
jgi:hypothetical protein